MKRRTLLAGLAGAPTVLSLPVRAQAMVKIAFGFSAVTDLSTAFVATDEGLFSKRGLDVEPRFIPLNPTIIPGIESGSLQMGGPTPLGYLQAVDGGLDHVVPAGGGSFSKKYTEIALVARAGTSIRSAADCVGKKIGVPGLGALLHVTVRQWLKLAGVDYSKVSFIEAPFPQHGDLIRGGSLDAVVTAGPFLARILEAGPATSVPTTPPSCPRATRPSCTPPGATGCRRIRACPRPSARHWSRPPRGWPGRPTMHACARSWPST